MNSALLPQRRRPSSDDNMIPLINIVFLLLIFFMIAGQITSVAEGDIAPPVSASDKPVGQPPQVVSLNVRGRLSLDGEPVELTDLADALISGQAQVAVKADKAVTAKDLDALFKALHRQGIGTITLYSSRAGRP